MSFRPPVRSALRLGLLAVGLFSNATWAHAQGDPNYTWTGGTGVWSNGANWGGTAPSPVPASQGDLTFTGTGPYTATNDISGNFGLQLLVAAQSSGTVTVNQTGGQFLTFNRWVDGNEDPGIRMNGAGNLNVLHLLDLNDQNLIVQGTGTGTLQIGDPTNPAAGYVFNNGANGTSVLTVNYAGGVTRIFGNNQQNKTVLQDGTVSVGANGALGIGSVDVTGTGTVTIRAAAGLSPTLANPINLFGDLSLGGGTGVALTLNGPIDLQGGTRTLTALDSKTTIGGPITNGGLTVEAGINTLTLTGTNTYAGPTTVNTGTLRLTGAGSIANSQTIQVNAGATLDVSGVTSGASFDGATGRFALANSQTLTGAGTVQGGVTARTGSTVSPGAENLTVNGSVSLTPGSTLAVTATGPGSVGRLSANGTVDVTGASLSVTGSGTGYSSTDRLWVVVNDGAGAVVGRFAGLANNGDVVGTFGGFTWGIFYDGDFGGGATGNDIYLAPVPEPTTVFGVAAAGLGLLGLARRARAGRPATA